MLRPHGCATVLIKFNSLKDVGGMKRSVAAVAVALTVGLLGCDDRSEAAPEPSPPAPADAPMSSSVCTSANIWSSRVP